MPSCVSLEEKKMRHGIHRLLPQGKITDFLKY